MTAEPSRETEAESGRKEAEAEAEGPGKLSARSVYQIIREEGDAELARPTTSLFWSGVAAGIGISVSVVAEGLLHGQLPDTEWRPLVENLGYSVGFLIVVLGRLQLFTENTITVVLPVMADRTVANLVRMLRLWAVVFLANMIGTFIFAVAAVTGIFPGDQLEAFLQLSRHFMAKEPLEMALHGVPAGFLVAAMVWMLPSAKGSDFWVILLITYIIALGDFTHVVAGSAEAFLLLVEGEIGVATVVGGFMLPALVGNIVGGTALFALLAYGQVKEEL